MFRAFLFRLPDQRQPPRIHLYPFSFSARPSETFSLSPSLAPFLSALPPFRLVIASFLPENHEKRDRSPLRARGFLGKPGGDRVIEPSWNFEGIDEVWGYLALFLGLFDARMGFLSDAVLLGFIVAVGVRRGSGFLR